MKRIAVIPGDGIGIDVTRESMRVLRRVDEVFGPGLEFVEFDWGAEKYLKEGIALPAGAFEMFRKDFDAILFGAVGDPRVPDQRHAAEILLALRFGLDLYANVRPVRLFDERLCPLKRSEEHTSELQSLAYLVCRLLLEKKKNNTQRINHKYRYYSQ